MGPPRLLSHPRGARAIPLRVGFVRWGFAGLLLVAAGLKAEPLFDSTGLPLTASSVLTIVTIAIEWGLAAWLLSGVAPVPARRAVIVLLLTFICVASWRLANHAADCGCFGSVKVHPFATLGLDILSFLSVCLLDRDPPTAAGRTPTPVTSPPVVRVVVALMVSITFSLSVVATAKLLRTENDRSMSTIALEPAILNDRPFPLLTELNPPMPELARGRWSVLIIDHNCSVCMEFLDTYHPSLEQPSLIIDIAEAGGTLRPGKAHGLKRSGNYILPGPLELMLDEGVVRAATAHH